MLLTSLLPTKNQLASHKVLARSLMACSAYE